MTEGSGSKPLNNGSGMAQKQMDPTDPDPQHALRTSVIGASRANLAQNLNK
jgi:hypothetical protein